MKKKREKLPEVSNKHLEDLAILASKPEFNSLLGLFKIEENNIIIQTFKINSSDPDLARKKSWNEGRMWELRKILKTFEEAKKEGKE